MKSKFKTIVFAAVLMGSCTHAMAQTRELSLREALQQASKNNRSLQIQLLSQRKSAEAVREAKSFLLPTVVANASYSIYGERPVIYLRNETASPKLDDIKYGGRFVFNGSIQASYPLINPEIKSNIRLSGLAEQIEKEEIKNLEERIALDVSQLYLTILMHQEQRKVIEQSVQRNERALKDSRSLFLQGKNLKTDTLSNYISVQNLKAVLSALDNNIIVLSGHLKQLMGMNPSALLIFTDTLLLTESGGELMTVQQTVANAETNRKDLKIQALRVDHAKEQLGNAKAAFKPTLSAVASYQLQSQADHLRIWNYGLPRTSFAGVTLSIPVFSGHRQKYKTTQSQISIRQNEVALAELKSSIQTEMVTLHARMQQAYDQWLIQQQNVEAAQISYTMMNDRYRHGLGTRLQLTDAELALTKSRLDYLQAVYSIRLTELQMKKAMGILQLN